MRKRIKLMSEDMISKIAAGEVVERPSSIVKELIENSIDAQSNNIEVLIENGGKDLILIKDDGIGISSDDLLLAFTRHATSKLNNMQDFENISSLGFRGEALASIASIANINIKTSTDNKSASEINVRAGEIGKQKKIARNRGLTISVRKLFDSLPARKKFLKSSDSEQIAITKIMKSYFLSNPEINFKYMNSKKEIYNLASKPLKNRIGDVFGKKHLDSLIKIESEKQNFKLSGYLGNLDLVSKRLGNQYLFVNGRYTFNRMINHSIYRSYSSLIDRGEYPFFVLELTMPPNLFDVNMHPTKREIRFKDEWKVNQFIKDNIGLALKNVQKTTSTFNLNPSYKLKNTSEEIGFDLQQISDMKIDQLVNMKDTHERVEEIFSEDSDINNPIIDDVWQIHNKYLVTHLNDGILIIDQHVAHERILYDSAIKGLNNNKTESQSVLFPNALELQGEDFDILIKLMPYLEKIGFRIKEFGENKVIIEGIPVYVKNNDEIEIIKHVIDTFDSFNEKDNEVFDKIAANYSCKAAIKSGDSLEKNEIKHLINRLFQSNNPYFCPHGRPIIVNLTINELDKRFERI